MNPYSRLERFEAKYGDYYKLLDDYVSAPESNNSRQRSLLTRHSELVWCWMGYQQGLKDATRGDD